MRVRAFATVVAVVVAGVAGGGQAHAADDSATVRVIVELEPGAGPVEGVADRLEDAHGADAGAVYEEVLDGFAAEVRADEVAALVADPAVRAVVPDVAIRAAGEVPSGVERVRADAVPGSVIGTRGRVDADIAILDTGVNPHADLDVRGGVDCTSDMGCVVSAPADGHGHGTHVAGSAAAEDDGTGVVGVAPGARVWSVKVLSDSGAGYLSWFVAGLDWAVAHGDIEVVNASLGGASGSNAAVDAAIDRATAAGVVVVVAAGNSGVDAAGTTPANSPSAITVSAVADSDGVGGGLGGSACGMPDDSFATFSNYGAVVDIAAPGVCITSTSRTGGYAVMSGTSMAAPHVAGAAAVHIAGAGLARDGERAARVLANLRGAWGAAASSPCGFTGGRSAEPIVVMGGCPGSGDTVAPQPVQLTASRGDRRVDLSWTPADDPAGIAAYRLVRGTGTGALVLHRTLPGDLTTFSDTGLRNGTTYRYALAAVDGSGNVGPLSAAVSAVPKDVLPPSQPVLAGVPHDRSAWLSWAPSTDASGIKSYQLWRTAPGGSPVLRARLSASARRYLDGRLTNGSAYRYTLVAVDRAGNPSPHSGAVTVTPFDDAPPSVPALRVKVGDGRLLLSWRASVDSSGVARYRLERAVGPYGTFAPLATLSGAAVAHVDTGLVNGTSYRYRLTAIDTKGLASAPSRVTGGAPRDLTRPAAVTVTADPGLVAGQVRLAWSGAWDRSGIREYQVHRSVGGGRFVLAARVAAGQRAWTATGVRAGTVYRWTVTAVDGVGNAGPRSAATTLSTSAAQR